MSLFLWQMFNCWRRKYKAKKFNLYVLHIFKEFWCSLLPVQVEGGSSLLGRGVGETLSSWWKGSAHVLMDTKRLHLMERENSHLDWQEMFTSWWTGSGGEEAGRGQSRAQPLILTRLSEVMELWTVAWTGGSRSQRGGLKDYLPPWSLHPTATLCCPPPMVWADPHLLPTTADWFSETVRKATFSAPRICLPLWWRSGEYNPALFSYNKGLLGQWRKGNCSTQQDEQPPVCRRCARDTAHWVYFPSLSFTTHPQLVLGYDTLHKYTEPRRYLTDICT